MPDASTALSAQPGGPLSPDASGASALMQQMQESDAETQKIVGAEQKEMQPAMDKEEGLLSAAGPKAPQLQAQPDAPNMRQQQAQDVHDFFFAAIAVAGIAGARARSHVTTALNAFGATLKGFREGQLQDAQQAYKEFQNASEAVKANNEAMQRDYQNALADRKASLDEQMARINMVAAKYHDPLMAQAASAKNYLMVGRLMQQQQDAVLKLGQQADKLIDQYKVAWAKVKISAEMQGFKLSDDGIVAVDPDSTVTKGRASFTDAALDNAAVKYGTTGQISAGFGGGDMRKQVQNRWGEMTQAMGMTPEQAAALPAEKKADAVALAMDTKWIDGVERSQEIVLGQIPIVQSYLDQLPLTEIQRVNGLILQGAREFGSPEAQAYGNAMSSLEMEWGRLSAGPQSVAMLPVEVMRIGANRFGNLTPNQFAAEAALLPKEAANSVQAQMKIIENRRKSLENLKPSLPTATPSPGAGGGANADPLGLFK
jgi:hypothetical protein